MDFTIVLRLTVGLLTDRDLDGVQGNPEFLIEMIQEKYEESRQAILKLKSLVGRKASSGSVLDKEI